MCNYKDYNVRPFGVKRGMKVKEAIELCPDIECVPVELINLSETQPDSDHSLPRKRARGAANTDPTTERRDCKVRAHLHASVAWQIIHNTVSVCAQVSLARYRRASFEVMSIFQASS